MAVDHTFLEVFGRTLSTYFVTLTPLLPIADVFCGWPPAAQWCSAVVSRMVDKEKGNEVEKEGTATSTGTRICCHFAQWSIQIQKWLQKLKNNWRNSKKTGTAFGLQDCAQYLS